MTPFLFTFFQIGFVVVFTRYAREIIASGVQSVQAKHFTWVSLPFRRSSSWGSVMILGLVFLLLAILPLFENDGLSLMDGNIGTVSAILFGICWGTWAISPQPSLPITLATFGAVLFSVTFLVGNVNIGPALEALLSVKGPAWILIAIAFGCIPLSFRWILSSESAVFHDGISLLWTASTMIFTHLLPWDMIASLKLSLEYGLIPGLSVTFLGVLVLMAIHEWIVQILSRLPVTIHVSLFAGVSVVCSLLAILFSFA